jgi:hypothetical protein
MVIKLDFEEIAQLIIEADRLWYREHAGQYDYQAHVKHNAKYIAEHYGVPAEKRRLHAHTGNKHRVGKKVSQLRLGEEGNGRVRRGAEESRLSSKRIS